ncbi:unnamed protein product [Phaedon cochleariae]|uniref:CREB-regulated transcription coactivator 1 n=1 Tax=Phaedon cochleariae TaxID=80249 RepID=A0A9P0DUP9_PHACE|nr:unnamed protein product [Phaedon cochleariae]
MANPRKFSEKIALHNHRQAEETAAFEQIMKEVIEVTAKDEPSSSNKLPAYRPEIRSRARSQCGPSRKTHDRRLDTSPYYLSPPTDTGWRRVNSDSALHQSTMQGMADRNNDVSSRGWNIPMMNGPDRNLDPRPRSSCDIPSASSRVPGISIYPSAHDPSMIQIPMANTGSLPDLTNVDFSSPIHAPLDQDHDSSPYSSSPVNTSPSALSPTSITLGMRSQGRFQFTPASQAHSNQLTVPFSARYHQQQQVGKNIQLDNNLANSVDSNNFTHLQGMSGVYHQQCSPSSPSPTLQQAAYRSPRPSPQSSPSPVGRHSAPCSPGAPSPLPNEFHNLLNQQATQFQQHFEQLSVLDPPTSYVDTTGAQQMTQSIPSSTISDGSCIGNIEMASDAGYYSTSPQQQLAFPSTSPGLHTTPNTPTSLPEIILTDFSGDDALRQDSFSRQFVSDYFSEEALKEGLGGPLDFEEIQILDSPSIGISENVENNFRLDHRS